MLFRTNKTGNTGGVAHNVPGMLIDNHVNQHIAWEDFSRNDFFLAVLDFDLILNGNHNIENHVAHVGRMNQAFEIGLNLVLIARIGMHYIPCSARIVLPQIHLFVCHAALT